MTSHSPLRPPLPSRNGREVTQMAQNGCVSNPEGHQSRHQTISPGLKRPCKVAVRGKLGRFMGPGPSLIGSAVGQTFSISSAKESLPSTVKSVEVLTPKVRKHRPFFLPLGWCFLTAPPEFFGQRAHARGPSCGVEALRAQCHAVCALKVFIMTKTLPHEKTAVVHD